MRSFFRCAFAAASGGALAACPFGSASAMGRVQENVLTFVVTGSTFKEPTAGFTGELKGDSWDWSSWTATGTLPSGLTIESTSTISPNKVIVDMSFKQGDAVQFTLKHEVAALLQENYERLHSQWKPQ